MTILKAPHVQSFADVQLDFEAVDKQFPIQTGSLAAATLQQFVQLATPATRVQGPLIAITVNLAAGVSAQTNVTPSIPASPTDIMFIGGFLDTGFCTQCQWSWGAIGSFGAPAGQYPIFVKNNGAANTATGTLKIVPVGLY